MGFLKTHVRLNNVNEFPTKVHFKFSFITYSRNIRVWTFNANLNFGVESLIRVQHKLQSYERLPDVVLFSVL